MREIDVWTKLHQITVWTLFDVCYNYCLLQLIMQNRLLFVPPTFMLTVIFRSSVCLFVCLFILPCYVCGIYHKVYVCFFVLMLNVPVNIFLSHVVTEPPLPGYYQCFSGSKCVFAQGHNMAEVGMELPTSRSGVRDSTTRPPL